MNRRFAQSALLCCVLALCALSRAQERVVVDRVIASVNGRPLLLSDWDLALRYEAFLQGRPPASFQPAERQEALNRVVDRELLRQQIQEESDPDPRDVEARIRSIRQQIKGAESDAAWEKTLAEFQLTTEDFRNAVAAEIQVLRLVEVRLRPVVKVDDAAIAAYYHDRLVPKLQAASVKAAPLDEVAGKIRELLAEEKLQALLEDWLINLRNQSSVHFIPEGARERESAATVQSLGTTAK